jgi:hypothetical protein
MDTKPQSTRNQNSDKHLWLADQIFTAFPQEVTGLRFYSLSCGCIYYQRVFRDGGLDPGIGIYRDAGDGPCEPCMRFAKDWKSRVLDETMIYRSVFQVGF